MAFERGLEGISVTTEESLVEFHPEPEEDLMPVAVGEAVWRILITDDDDEVHVATAYALRNVRIAGRPLTLLHARSAAEALDMLRAHDDVAVAMLDVVMDTPDAGLRLVREIRDTLGLDAIRIVLRTGQPGYAPELEVMQRYDINDYRTKSELSQVRLVTTLTAAIRAWDQIGNERVAARAMDAVARVSGMLFRSHDSAALADAVLVRIEELLATPLDAFFCAEVPVSGTSGSGLHVIATRGRFRGIEGREVDKLDDVELIRAMRRCLAARTSLFDAGRFLLWIGNGTRDAVLLVEHPEPLRHLQRRVIEVFAASLAIGFENVDLIERLDFFAFSDPLTGLPNRTRFLSSVDQALLSRQGHARSLMLLDLADFSTINETLGHRTGDSLLVSFARRLRKAFGSEVLVARISGDTFGLFGHEGLLAPAQIGRACEQPFFVQGHMVSVRVHVGLARVADCPGNAMELLRCAGLALGEARRSGNASCVYGERLSDDMQLRVRLLHSLRASIDFHHGLSMHYQPLLTFPGSAVHAVEAFTRWRAESGETILPNVFIPLAERTGMIHDLGLWAMRQAIEDLAAWQRQGWPELGLVLNVSIDQLRSSVFVRALAEQLDLCDVQPRLLTLDLRDDIARESAGVRRQIFEGLHRIGVRLALDDFGCGQAVFRDLAGLPVDELKIDRSLVQALDEAGCGRAVVFSILQLARERGLAVVAEGIEHAGQAEALAAMGCELMQGFHFGPPMPATQLESWLAERRRLRA